MIRAELNQARLAGGQKVPLATIQKAMQAIAKAIKIRSPLKVSIAFVSSSEMRRLNRVHRGKDRGTDVLSFEMREGELLGEVLLNYEQAKRQAKEQHHAIRDEVTFLIVHGTLHLLGYDHERPQDAKRMFALQTGILQTLGIDPCL